MYDVAGEDQGNLQAGRERGVLRRLGTGIADTVEEHADLPGLDPSKLLRRATGRKAWVEGDADRADLIREATELTRLFGGRHLGDQGLDPVALRKHGGRAERQAGDGRAAGQHLATV